MSKLNPFSKIPPELLSEIFLCLISGIQNFNPITWIKTINILLNVCTQWKHVSTHSPFIWNILKLHILDNQLEHAAFIIRKWTTSMNKRKLTLSIVDYIQNKENPILDNLYKSLHNNLCIAKLHLLNIHFPTHLHFLNEIHLPKLELLHIQEDFHDYNSNIISDIQYAPLKINCPQLSELAVDSEHLEILKTNQLKNIISLHILGCSHKGQLYLDILKNFPLIKTLSIIDESPIDSTNRVFEYENIQLPNLTFLSINPESITTFALQYMIITNLQFLGIHKSHGEPSIRNVIPILKKDLPLLQSIHISGSHILQEKEPFQTDVTNLNHLNHPIEITWEENLCQNPDHNNANNND